MNDYARAHLHFLLVDTDIPKIVTSTVTVH